MSNFTRTLRIVFVTALLVGRSHCFVEMPSMVGTRYLVSPNFRPAHFTVTGPSQNKATDKLRATVTTVDPETTSTTETKPTPKIIGSIDFLLPSEGADSKPSKFGSFSPVGNPTLLECATQLASKAQWFSENQVVTRVVSIPKDGHDDLLVGMLHNADVLIAIGLSSDSDLKFAKDIFEFRASNRDRKVRFRQCEFALDCAKSIASTVGPFDAARPTLSSLFPWTDAASGRRLLYQMQGLFDRWTSDDAIIAILLFLNRFSGSEIDWVKHSNDATWEKGPLRNAQEFYTMASKCGDCVTTCLKDETCKECLQKLTELDTRDQALSYRTIVSYESEALRDFSYCILTKHNVFQCDAAIPTIPKVTPMATWRNKALTVEAGQSLLVAHLNDEAAPEVSRIRKRIVL
jgi:hypothetical protein